MKTVKLALVVMLIASFSTAVSAQKKVDPTGTWVYEASAAPYEYSTGDMVIAKDGKDYTLEMVLGEYYKLKAEKVVYENNELSCVLYIEGESVEIKVTVEKDTFAGTASYSEGTIPITGKKKK